MAAAPRATDGGTGGITMEAMRRHLDSVFIGFRPGDPTPPLPAMPPPSEPQPEQLQRVNLRQMTMAELSAEAAATQPADLFGALLPDPPGVPPDRLAYVTGQGPRQPEDQEGRQQAEQQQQGRGAAGPAAQPARDAVVEPARSPHGAGSAKKRRARSEAEDAGPAAASGAQ